MTYYVSDRDKAIAVANSWAHIISQRDKCKVNVCRNIIVGGYVHITVTLYWESAEDIENYFKKTK